LSTKKWEVSEKVEGSGRAGCPTYEKERFVSFAGRLPVWLKNLLENSIDSSFVNG